jgi:hypothetical protein
MVMPNIAAKNDLKKLRTELIEKYGTPTLEFHNKFSDSSSDQVTMGISFFSSVFVFESAKIIVIAGKELKFEDILDFKINNEISYSESTSTSSAISRGIVGGLAFGGIGAIAGATTASKQIQSNGGVYKINVITKDLANPSVSYQASTSNCADKMVAVLSIIIDRNKLSQISNDAKNIKINENQSVSIPQQESHINMTEISNDEIHSSLSESNANDSIRNRKNTIDYMNLMD